MKANEYFQRIGIDGNLVIADLSTLKLLQKQHLLKVPFENLDIHWNNPIVLGDGGAFKKIVEGGRGGFCYELNGLFSELLMTIGYRCRIISARVGSGEGNFGPEYDHLAILAQIDNEEYLVDVGFGDFSAEPLRFVLDLEQMDGNGVFSIKKFDDDYFEVIRKDGDDWNSQYIFNPKARNLSEFAGMCNFHQTSPDSHFTKGRVCSLMTENGRKTLTEGKFIETRHGTKTETEIGSNREFEEFLEKEFNIKKEALANLVGRYLR